MKLAELCPLAEQIILDDPYLDEQTHMDSGPSCFWGKLREDAFFVRNKFERQFNTLYEIVWMLLYRSISLATNTGPYVVQIPNFEIRKVDGVRRVHNLGWCELTRNGEVTRRGAILLLWLAEVGERAMRVTSTCITSSITIRGCSIRGGKRTNVDSFLQSS